jgi:hypothetical protein
LVAHHYAQRNRSKAEIEALTEKKRRAGAAGGRRSGVTRRSRTEAPASPDAEQTGSTDPSETNPTSNTQLSTAAAATADAAAAAARARHPTALGPAPAAGAAVTDPVLAILKQKLDVAGLAVRWDQLDSGQAARIAGLVQTHGDAALVRAAQSQRAGHDTPPLYVQAWLGVWESLPLPGLVLAPVPDPACDLEDHDKDRAARYCRVCRSEQLEGRSQ